MGYHASFLESSFGVFESRMKSQLSEEKRLLHLPQPHRDGVLCGCVCVAAVEGGRGVAIVKSSVRADQDPVNQAACERMRAW